MRDKQAFFRAYHNIRRDQKVYKKMQEDMICVYRNKCKPVKEGQDKRMKRLKSKIDRNFRTIAKMEIKHGTRKTKKWEKEFNKKLDISQ